MTVNDFSQKNLQGVSFKSKNLNHAIFRNSDLRGVDFTESDLTGADFSHVRTGITPLNTVYGNYLPAETHTRMHLLR